MPAIGQDEWWRPVSDVPVTEARWVRAVEMRPGTPAGRKDHASCAGQAGPGRTATRSDSGSDAGAADGMGDRQKIRYLSSRHRQAAAARRARFAGTSTITRWAKRFAINVELARVSLSQRSGAEVPHAPAALLAPGVAATASRHSAQPIANNARLHRAEPAARLENFQPHMHLRGKAMAMEAILPDGTTQMLSYVDISTSTG